MKNYGIKVLFLYPNTFGMNMLPPAIALFSALLKREGHQVKVFDTTYYEKLDETIENVTPEGIITQALTLLFVLTLQARCLTMGSRSKKYGLCGF